LRLRSEKPVSKFAFSKNQLVPLHMVTNPSKKGTYGMRGTTLGERIAAGGAVGEYTYKGDDYDGARKVRGFGCVALQLCTVTVSQH
jgi:hypothetical protein